MDTQGKLLSVSEAQQQLLEAMTPVEAITMPTVEAAGYVLHKDIQSAIDLPPFSNSSMDGFAVRSADVANASPVNPIKLAVVADIPAGEPSSIIIQPGQAARIMTGAPVPQGANAVIPVEDTDENHHESGKSAEKWVQINRDASEGAYVRPRGEDLKAGAVVLTKGRRLRPQDMGILATLGISQVTVYRKPRLALLSSGDELLPIDAPLQPGKIRESNAYTLAALAAKFGGEAVRLGIMPDEKGAIKAALDQALSSQADLIISSAGVSVGAYDFVRDVVEENGALSFWRVNMRPGKPVAFGHFQGTPFIGLPGNPVSAFVGFMVFVKSAIEKLAGEIDAQKIPLRAELLEPVESDGRESYLRAQVFRQETKLVARLTGHQGSGNLFSLVQANALVVIPAEIKSLPAGAEVEVWRID